MRIQTTASLRHQQHLSQQRRSVLYISQEPVSSPSPSPQETVLPTNHHQHHQDADESDTHNHQVLLESPRHKMIKSQTLSSASTPLAVMRIGLALLVFWLVILTLFMLSHILHDSVASPSRLQARNSINGLSLETSLQFPFPANGSAFIGSKAPESLTYYRTCCWDRARRFFYCDGGAFSTVWDQANQSVVFHPVMGSPLTLSDLHGGECTLICK